jgi:hypothetical protein
MTYAEFMKKDIMKQEVSKENLPSRQQDPSHGQLQSIYPQNSLLPFEKL